MSFAILQVFCAIFSGILQSLSIANDIFDFGSPVIALVCLSPFYLAFYSCRSYGESFRLFSIQALTTHVISSYWLANFHGFAVFTLGASALGTAAEAGLCGIVSHAYPHGISKSDYVMEFSGKKHLFMPKRVMWFSICWILYEYVKSVGALGYPWGTLSMAAYEWRIVAQIADISGVWGISFLFAMFSAVFAEGAFIACRRLFFGKVSNFSNYLGLVKSYCVLMAVCLAYGSVQYYRPRVPEKNLNAVLVQQDVDPWEGGDSVSIDISKHLTEDGILEFEKKGIKPDIVVWSEGVLSKSFPRSVERYRFFPPDESLSDFIARKNVPFIIGGLSCLDRNARKYGNSAVLFDAFGNYSGFYTKMQLVPFAEKVPYSDNPLMHAFMTEVVKMPSTLTEGFQHVLFRIPLRNVFLPSPPLNYGQPEKAVIALDACGRSDPVVTGRYLANPLPNPGSYVDFTVPICFEDAFPSSCSKLYDIGSEVFINITNDSWSKTKAAEYQHYIVSSYRAIEYRTTLVRCTNSGYTSVTDPSGRILDSLPLFEEGFLASTVPIYGRCKTLYSRYGDYFAKISMLIVLMFVAFSIYKIGREDL